MDVFVVLGAELDAGGTTGAVPPRENQLLRFSGGEYEWIDEAEAESDSEDAPGTGTEAGGSAVFLSLLLFLLPLLLLLLLLLANKADRPAIAGEALAVAGADDAKPLTLGDSPTSAVAAGAFLLLTLPLSPPREVAEVKALAASRRLSPLFFDLAFLLLVVEVPAAGTSSATPLATFPSCLRMAASAQIPPRRSFGRVS